MGGVFEMFAGGWKKLKIDPEGFTRTREALTAKQCSQTSFLLKHVFLFYMFEFDCVCALCTRSAAGGQKRQWTLLEPEFWVVVSHYVEAGNRPGSPAGGALAP